MFGSSQYCAPGKGDGKSCFTTEQLRKIARAWNQKHSNGQNKIDLKLKRDQLWDQVWKRLSDRCGTEYCWVDQDFVRSTQDPELLNHTFRPERPLGRYQWLSTNNIHEAMKQYEHAHPDFRFIGAVPMDFADVMPHVGKLAVAKLYKKGVRKIGIVFNTDPSHKPGKHWIAMFIQLNPNQPVISYYDSFAICPPPKAIRDLVDHIKRDMQGTFNREFVVNCNRVRHQFAETECGTYSMYFILESLRGKSFNQISNTIILDEEMNQKRDLFFRPQQQQGGRLRAQRGGARRRR